MMAFEAFEFFVSVHPQRSIHVVVSTVVVVAVVVIVHVVMRTSNM